MSYRQVLTGLLSALTFTILLGCQEQKGRSDEKVAFKKINVRIENQGVLPIQNCARWYIDFSRIKCAMIYQDKIICMGLNGGFACLNRENFQQDTLLQNQLNDDFYTDAVVWQDTLFAEKFQELYYWNHSTWRKYENPIPINYFSLLAEDKQYAFYASCGGEFGSMLFVYNKLTRTTHAQVHMISCPTSVTKTEQGYVVDVYSNYGGTFEHYLIKDVERLKLVSDTLRNANGRFDLDPRFAFLHDTTEAVNNNLSAEKMYYVQNLLDPQTLLINASFWNRGKLYHLIENREDQYSPEKEGKKYLGTVTRDSLHILDTLPNLNPLMVNQFANTTLINEEFYGEGFTLIRNDTIFKVYFSTRYPKYAGPQFLEYNLSMDSSTKPVKMVDYIFHSSLDKKLKKGQPERELSFTYRNKYVVVGRYGNHQDAIILYIGPKAYPLKNFQNKWNFLKNVFTYDDRLFLFLGNLGNKEFKYGLLEITDVERFAYIYQKSH